MKKGRILTGDRTTGKLHLGHYVGSLANRVKLQYDYETFIILADVQALTTNFDNPEKIREDVYQVAMDYLATGIDPEEATIFIQSMIPEIAELTVFYSMFTSVNLLRHNPTTKSEAQQRGYEDLMYGFLGYPVSQAADITFCKADLVPVGEDQIPHIELTRKIVRRFNDLYGTVLVEPKALIGDVGRLVGLDGNSKMSKSLNNAIYLSDSKEEIDQKVRKAVTDPQRIALSDKGNPDVCTVYIYQQVFNKDECPEIAGLCRSAGIGCMACKRKLALNLNELLEPMRERRKYFETNRQLVKDILVNGTEKARHVAQETMREVREAMSINYF